MTSTFSPFTVHILPRQSMAWDEFLKTAPPRSIALDGIVRGGPNYHPKTHHINFDHHDCVVREATMSTAMQVYFALKGGLMNALTDDGTVDASIFINDTDQDTALAVWYLLRYKDFEGTSSIPAMSRLLALNDRWDITGGAFPMNLSDELVEQHTWVFQPYANLRRSGALSVANEHVLLDNLAAVLGRLNLFVMGQAQKVKLDTRHEILHNCPSYKIVHEIGGNEARYFLYNHGMDAFVSIVAIRSDGRFVYSIGRRSRYVQFPVEQLYDDLNTAEGFDRNNGWNGSDIIGGSSRMNGSGLHWERIREIVNRRLAT